MFNLQKFETHLSPARLNAYRQFLRNAGQSENNIEPKLYELYLWNVQASSAFLELLSFYEVALRNAILLSVRRVHRYSIFDSRFIQSLPEKRRNDLFKVINDVSGERFEYTHNRPIRIDPNQVNENAVIAKLNFHFWESLLSKSYASRYLEHHYRVSFPNAKSARQIKQIHRTTKDIRDLRNRVCHNEPIFKKKNLKRLYLKALVILKWIDKEYAAFVLENTVRLREMLDKPI